MLIGTWVDMMLFAFEIYQVVYILRNFPNDRLIIKLMILTSLVVDTVCVAATCANVYIVCPAVA
jgi:hypothetical protein